MISRVPSPIEMLESRWAPARLIAGPLPAQFGADLGSLDVPDILSEAADVAALIAELAVTDPNGAVAWLNGMSESAYGSASAGSFSSGLVKTGAGTLRIAGTLTFSGSLIVDGLPISIAEMPITRTLNAGSPLDGTWSLGSLSAESISAGQNLLNSSSIVYSGEYLSSASLVVSPASLSASSLSLMSPRSNIVFGTTALPPSANQLVLGSYLSMESLTQIANTLSPTDPTVLISALQTSGATLRLAQEADATLPVVAAEENNEVPF